MGLLDLFPGRRKRAAEKAEAEAQARVTAQREAEVEPLIQDSLSLAQRLAKHRAENHFAQRINSAFEMR